MYENSLVSIIITCYNDYKFIEESVNSAINQTYQNKEIIIVDDGSKERTKSILKSLEAKVTKIIYQFNQGVSVARNIGVNAAQGKYIIILDSDDFFMPSFCEKAIKIFNKENDVVNVTCKARWFWDDLDYQIFEPVGGTVVNFLKNNSSLANSLFTKDKFLEVGGYDEKMIHGYEDWEFFIRLHEKGGHTYVIPEILFNYRKKKISRSTKSHNYKYDLLEYIYLKHSNLYINNFEVFVKDQLAKRKWEEKEKIKNTERIDFLLGKNILKPFRFLKSKFKT
ncbi:glycosyltransferase family 2 protein [Gillisia sp. Hel_I_29]|uniref:glycosyltransferase family 2 protein n=1 Tax=Gillisia sp. Hel_I_29 TaxID=1249975 RepID=UPI00055219BB|nr:glycosyltransferase family 2 protein [Gillisia sp. Hel_I_29]